VLAIVEVEALPVREELAWLRDAARRELDGCRRRAHDGTILFTPDGQGHYGALWTRDFAYVVENAYDLLSPVEIRAAIAYLLRGQRADGCIPDRVRVDGRAVYSAGAVSSPLGGPPTDNAQFMIDLVYRHVWRSGDLAFARRSLAALQRAADFIPRDADGLVFIPPGRRQSPYGFTDTVAKTGALFFSSLLYWRACKQMTELCTWCDIDPSLYPARAEQIERGMERLWDEERGAYLAATVACRQIDVWGNAFAFYIGFLEGERRNRVLSFLRDRCPDYTWRGQVRHLLRGEYWERTLIPVAVETYQNGAYWAAASGWVFYALAQVDETLALKMMVDLVANLRGGMYECVNVKDGKLDHYVVSAVNPLGALQRWTQENVERNDRQHDGQEDEA
jgi:hypothetical protein